MCVCGGGYIQHITRLGDLYTGAICTVLSMSIILWQLISY